MHDKCEYEKCISDISCILPWLRLQIKFGILGRKSFHLNDDNVNDHDRLTFICRQKTKIIHFQNFAFDFYVDALFRYQTGWRFLFYLPDLTHIRPRDIPVNEAGLGLIG